MVATPLQVILCWYAPEAAAASEPPPDFIEAAYRAFVGRSATDALPGNASHVANWITGVALAPAEIRSRRGSSPFDPREELDRALHTVVFAWISDAVLTARGPEFAKWIGAIWAAVNASGGRHALLLGMPDERLRKDFFETASKLGAGSLKNCEVKTWESLGEEAERPAAVSLRALELARGALSQGLGQGREPQPLRLFISHAKRDGLTLAQSLILVVEKIGGVLKFYDAQDIHPGTNWEEVLKKNAESSVMIALRTDQYDLREACAQEIAWAESAGAPIIVVEARNELFHPPSPVDFDRCPWVRVTDGNLTRIAYTALRENLRYLLVRRAVHEMGPPTSDRCVVLPRAPTWHSLDGAFNRLPDDTTSPTYVVYPDPVLLPTARDALERFAAARKQGARVLSYSSLAAGDLP